MKEKTILSKEKYPLSAFKTKLLLEEFELLVRQYINNFNPNASKESIMKSYETYLSNYEYILSKNYRCITATDIGFFSKTHLNTQYWLDRCWTIEEAKNKIKARQSTCTPEIAKKIQKTLSLKSAEEIAEINRKKGNGLNPDFLVKKHNITKEQAEKIIFDQCSNAGKIKNETYKKLGKAVSNRQLSYYLEKGMSLEEAKICLAERQNTTSLQAFIRKYGETDGVLRYNQRIEKFKKKWIDKPTDEKKIITVKRLQRNKFFSNESYTFFEKLEKELLNLNQDVSCLYGNNEFFLYDAEDKKLFFYDFCIPEKKLIIEYHGSYWHANPLKSEKDWKQKLYTYEESLKKDNLKKILAEKNGYEYHVIWDYERNLKETINKLMYKILK